MPDSAPPAPLPATAPNHTGVVRPPWADQLVARWRAVLENHGRTVLDALADTDPTVPGAELTPDRIGEELRALGALNVEIRFTPRRALGGHALILWRYKGARYEAEGHTLDVAHRRALRALRRLSGVAETEGGQ